MCIKVYQEPIELQYEEKENCIFCNCETAYWTSPKYNRPCCPMCSVLHNDSEIPDAPYGY